MRIISTFRHLTTGELISPYVYFAITDAGTITTSFMPPTYDPDIHDNPVVLSPNKTLARRWRYSNAGFTNQQLPVAYGTHEYVMMTAPNGTQYVYTIDNTGTWGSALWTADASRTRDFTLLHKGDLVWVGDNRQPMPRKGDV
jgi:hypothetical protein